MCYLKIAPRNPSTPLGMTGVIAGEAILRKISALGARSGNLRFQSALRNSLLIWKRVGKSSRHQQERKQAPRSDQADKRSPPSAHPRAIAPGGVISEMVLQFRHRHQRHQPIKKQKVSDDPMIAR